MKYKEFSIKDAEIAASSLDIIYKELGLQQAIQYLYSFLKEYYPITRIFCGFRLIESPVFYPIADTLTKNLEKTKFAHSYYNTPLEKEYFIPRNSLEPYIPIPLDGMLEGNNIAFSRGIGRDEDYISHLRIPLFFQEERIFQIALCSNKAHAFKESDFKSMKTLVRKISQSILLEYQKIDENFAKMHGSPTNITTLLELCRGFQPLISDIKKLAPTDYTALIEGETGSGKGIVAQALHDLSTRRDKPFIKVNCGAISESLLESELFGHEKGAFTGALVDRKGFFEAAEGGSIFLDEIGELSLRLQTTLLRVVENKCIQKIGSNQEIPIDVRIIVATNKDLEKEANEGNFRLDLWYRLTVFPLKVPALRIHREDIPSLVHYFTENTRLSLGIANTPKIPENEMNKLYEHSWPGNIRELKNLVERSIIRAKNGEFCKPLEFHINYKENVQNFYQEEEEFLSLEEYSSRYVKKILEHTKGKITGKDGAASILKLHPNTVRQYKNNLFK